MSIKKLLLAVLLTGFVCLNAHAKYTQMIIDNNNRIMPIFFHNEPTQPTQRVLHVNRPPTQRAPFVNPTPAQRLPLVSLPPVIQPRILQPERPPVRPRNPLTGPYYISPERHNIMAAAHQALGIPYIYGGNNPRRGLDCSSLMQFIHKKAVGVRLPRTAAQQRDQSRTISFNRLQPGDLLFFKIDRRSNHVGIYIGNGKFIHASSSNKRASIASMDRPYWKKRFVKFGSYLGS